MPRPKPLPEPRVAAELNALRFLCAGNMDSHARNAILQTLGDYVWSSNDHRLFFECIRDLAMRDPQHILDNLPAALTRRGFPDMPCETLAQPAKLNSTSALALAQTLVHLKT